MKISLGTPRTLENRYIYKSPVQASLAAAKVNASDTELRRLVGQNQSMTNYYDSEAFYNRQSKLFKPITKTTEESNVKLTTALEKLPDNMANRMLETIANYERPAAEPAPQVEQAPALITNVEQAPGVSRADVAGYFNARDLTTDHLFEISIMP